jgi:hypothetical protein
MSVGKHVSNFAGEKKEWPVYISISQSSFEDPPDTLNAQRHDGRTPADIKQEPQYSSEAAE